MFDMVVYLDVGPRIRYGNIIGEFILIAMIIIFGGYDMIKQSNNRGYISHIVAEFPK